MEINNPLLNIEIKALSTGAYETHLQYETDPQDSSLNQEWNSCPNDPTERKIISSSRGHHFLVTKAEDLHWNHLEAMKEKSSRLHNGQLPNSSMTTYPPLGEKGFGWSKERKNVTTVQGNFYTGFEGIVPWKRATEMEAKRRLYFKNGDINITAVNVSQKARRYLADFFNTLIDCRWRFIITSFVLSFAISWVLFALFWYLICLSNGDFNVENVRGSNHVPCVMEVNDFVTALLYSVETQHTIGYGTRQLTGKCPTAVILLMVQSVFGTLIQAFMTGLVFAKITKPKRRANTVLFSKNAVICIRDGVLILLFRVGDLRRSHIINSSIRCIMIKQRVTKEGEVLEMQPFDLPVNVNDSRDNLFLSWPAFVEHPITPNSPLWNISAANLKIQKFEIIVILEGALESTGGSFQARTSYLPQEIMWGHRFEHLLTFQKINGRYILDYEKFHNIIEIEHFPLCSAKYMHLVKDRVPLESEQILDEGEDKDISKGRFNQPVHHERKKRRSLKKFVSFKGKRLTKKEDV